LTDQLNSRWNAIVLSNLWLGYLRDEQKELDLNILEENTVAALLGMPHLALWELAHIDLKVMWAPNSDSKEHGEVKGNVILIYDEEKKTALETLKHEFLHYSIHKEVVEPLIKYINLEKALIEDLIYRRVEDLVDRLSKLL
jgi:hypothetical protein